MYPTRYVLLPSEARTQSGESDPIDVSGQEELLVFLHVTAKSGTPTLDVTLQTQDPIGNWHVVETFAQKTDVGIEMKKVLNFGVALRAKYVIGGGTPSITFSVTAWGKRR